VVLLLLFRLSLAAAPLRPDSREVPPDRGRLFIKDPMIFKGLLDDLRTQSAGPSKRINAIGIFVLTREQNVVRHLLKIAMNPNDHIDVRVASLWALGEIGDPAGLPALQSALAEILADPGGNAWRQSKGISADVNGETITVPVKDMVMDQLARLGEMVLPQLVALLREPLDENITTNATVETANIGRMRAALVTLVAVGDRAPSAVRTLCDVLRADDKYYPPDFKVIAAQGLASLATTRKKLLSRVQARDKIAEEIARAFVEACVISDVHQVREVAGTALRGIGRADSAVLELLIILNNPNIPKMVRYRTIEALAFIHATDKATRAKASETLIVQLHHENHHVRWRAAISLGAVGDRRAIPYLRRLTHDEDAMVRTKVIAALGHMEAKEALPDLVGAMTDGDHRVRRQAALALGRLDSHAGLPALLRYGLKDEYASVRQSAVIALGYIGSAKGLRATVDLLNDPIPEVRLTVVHVVSRYRNPGAVRALAIASVDPDKSVRNAATAALHDRFTARPADTVSLLVKVAREEAGAARHGAIRCLAADWRTVENREDTARAKTYVSLLTPPKGQLSSILLGVLADKKQRKARRDAALLLVEAGWKYRIRPHLEAVAALENDLDIEVRNTAKRAKNYLSNLPKR
jgi:HEAT repeat protein